MLKASSRKRLIRGGTGVKIRSAVVIVTGPPCEVVNRVAAIGAISAKDEGRRTKAEPACANHLSSFVLRRYTPLDCTKRLAICPVAVARNACSPNRIPTPRPDQIMSLGYGCMAALYTDAEANYHSMDVIQALVPLRISLFLLL